MATNTTLVQGAYDANTYRGAGVDTAQKAIGEDLNEAVGKLAANRRKEKEAEAKQEALEISAEEALDRGVVKDDVEQVKGRVQLLQDEFIDPNTSEQRKQEIQQEIEALGGNMNKLNEITSGFAESAINQDISAGATGEQTEFLNLILSDRKKLMENPDKPGEYGFDFKGSFISTAKANKMLGQTQIDVGAINKFSDLRNNSINVDNVDASFPEAKVNDEVGAIMKGAENRQSLFYDNMFGNTSMYEDMKAGTLAITYESLGLSPEQIEKYDTDGSKTLNGADMLNGEDQGSVIDAFFDMDEYAGQRDEILKGYLTEHIRRNFKEEYIKKHGQPEWDSHNPPPPQQAEQPPTNNQQPPPPIDQKVPDVPPDEGDVNINGGTVGENEEWTAYNDDWIKTEEGYSTFMEKNTVEALTPISILHYSQDGKVHILENGNKITMKDIDLMPGVSVDVGGVRVQGEEIVIDSVIKSFMGEKDQVSDFGKFVKNNNGEYKWKPGDKKAQKMFKEHATKSQQASLAAFIKQVEADPRYAKYLLKHIKDGKGSLNAATLKINK